MISDISFCENLVLRTPILPNKKSISIAEMQDLLDDKFILEAIYIASPSLYWNIMKWKDSNLSQKEEKKLLISCYKYLNRMMNRSTPFGLFSGCSVIKWGDTTNITLQDEKSITRHTRLDMYYLCKLTAALEKLDFIRKELIFFSNSSINIKEKKLTFVEYQYRNKTRFHSISEVELNEYIDLILKNTRKGIEFKKLIKVLQQYDPEISEEEAEEYLNLLIDSQLIKSELEPNVTGDEYYLEVLKTFSRISAKNERIISIYERLKLVLNCLSDIDEKKNNNCDKYKEIYSILEVFQVDIDISKLFQVDLYRKSEPTSTLGRKIQNEIKECVLFLEGIYRNNEHANLKKFKNKFRNRYGTSEVKLLDVVDTESGLGYPIQESKLENYLSKELNLPYTNQLADSSIQISALELDLFRELQKNKNFKAIDISHLNKLKNDLKTKPKDFSPSLAVHFKILKGNNSDLQVFLKSVPGGTGTFLLSRFASSNNGIHSLINELVIHENKVTDSNTILSEIAHLPDDRLGNVVIRPSLREYEIPYLAKSNVHDDKKILLSDITMSYDSQIDELILKSSKLGKRIIPKHSNAYNIIINEHPVFRLLCDIQIQKEIPGLRMTWGNLEKFFKHFPRLMYKNVIILRESWLLTRNDFKDFLEGNESIEKWKHRHELPNIFILNDGYELLIDSKNELSITAFKDVIKNKNQIRLCESLIDKKNDIVKDSQGANYAHEFIALLLRKEEEKISAQFSTKSKLNNSPSVLRNLVPGSNWLYYKIFCGLKYADTLISQFLLPIAEKFKTKNIISHWFFIRYKEDHFHIRFRLFFPNPKNQGKFMNYFAKSTEQAQKEGLIWKIQIDTYERELERYGRDTIDFSERLFYYDSLTTAKIITLIENIEEKKLKEFACFLSIDNYLNLFKFDLNRKKVEMEKLKNLFGKEFGIEHKAFKKSLDKKYRSLRKDLDNLFNHTNQNYSLLKEIVSERTVLINSEKQQLENVVSILPSYLHMNINRFFSANQRLNEFILYYCLDKHYESLIARKKYNTQHIE